MPGLTMTDCSVADNVTQARYEFERADGDVGKLVRADMLAAWALKCGASLLEVAAEHAGTESSAADEDEITRLESEISAIRSAMLKAIDALESA